MRLVRVAGFLALLLLGGWAPAPPGPSAEVVKVKLRRYTIADGLESFFVTLEIRKGWHLHANPAGAASRANLATTVTFLVDGKDTATVDVYYPKGTPKKDHKGNTYHAYEGTVSFTGWLVWEETSKAKEISAHVKVHATDGKTARKPSIVTARVR